MILPGYGAPSPDEVLGTLQPRFRQIEQHCRDWCALPSRQTLRSLASALGGMAILARLCRQGPSGRCARRALRRLRGNQTVPDRAVVVQCLGMLDGWTGRPAAEHHWRVSLAPLRDAALGVLRLPKTDRTVLSGPVLQYLALRACLTGQRPSVRSAAMACRRLLDDEGVLQEAPRRFAGDMALALDVPLFALGSGTECPDRRRGALQALYRELSVLAAADRLRCLALPAEALRQALWLIVMHLRHHPGDWPSGSRAVLIRHLLALQWVLMTAPEDRAVGLSPVMRQTGQFLRAWRQDSGPGGDAAPWLDAPVRWQVREELRAELNTVTRELPGDEDRPVSPALCAALARLHLTLHLTGYRQLAWWSDSLQQSMLAQLQAGHPAGPLWRRRLLLFRGAVLAGPVRGDASAPGGAMAVEHGRAVLEAATDEARLLTALRRNIEQPIPMDVPDPAGGGPDGVGEPGWQRPGTVIDQLSGGMTRLPDPATWSDALEEGGTTAGRSGLMRSVARELAILEKGARMLGVPRIEALAAVLRSVYRQIGVAGGREDTVIVPDRALLMALRRGHAGLLHRLDQAAAWQTISRPQPVIEYLYRCLEARQSGRPGNALSLPQRCLSINRRLQALLDAAPPASDAERRTLMLTLMRDQARLLKTMTAPDRNRRGQRV